MKKWAAVAFSAFVILYFVTVILEPRIGVTAAMIDLYTLAMWGIFITGLWMVVSLLRDRSKRHEL